MLYVTVEDLREADDGISDEDLLELEEIRRSSDIDYNSLFFLYGIQNPFGWDQYNGSRFAD